MSPYAYQVDIQANDKILHGRVHLALPVLILHQRYDAGTLLQYVTVIRLLQNHEELRIRVVQIYRGIDGVVVNNKTFVIQGNAIMIKNGSRPRPNR